MRTSSFFTKKPTSQTRARIDRVLLDEFHGGIHRSIFTGKGIEFKRLRPYNPSVDRPAAVDDMASHRLSEEPEFEPYSRVRYSSKQISVVALLDVSDAMRSPVIKEEHSALLFWFFALSTFKQYDRFRVIPYAPQPIADSGWLEGEDELVDFFTLYGSATKPAEHLKPFPSVYSYLPQCELHDTVIFIISDFARSWKQESVLLRSLAMRERNIQLVLCAMNEWEEFIPPTYAMTVRDPRIGRLREFRPEELRGLKSEALSHLAAVEESVRPLGALFISIPMLADPLVIVRRSLYRTGFK